MKNVKTLPVLALSMAAVLSFTACKKNEITPTTNPASGASAADAKLNGPRKYSVLAPVYDEGFRSITALTSGSNADIGYVMNVGGTFTNMGSTYRQFDLGGDLISATSAMCYGAAAPQRGGFNLNAKEALVYNDDQGYARLSIANGLGTSDASGSISYGGSGVYILIGGNLTTLKFEEIEINPADGMIYGIVKNGNAIQFYKIEDSGTATAMTYTANGTTTMFYNPNGNGYKSGSIAFVETYSGSGVWELAFASESTVYSTQGIVVWRYSVDPTLDTYTIITANNRTYNPASLYGAQTGHINIASNNGIIYFARDNSAMYTLNGTNNSTTAVTISTTGNAYANDFGFYKAF